MEQPYDPELYFWHSYKGIKIRNWKKYGTVMLAAASFTVPKTEATEKRGR
jgi:hypothetical protein